MNNSGTPWATRIRECRLAIGWRKQHELADAINKLHRQSRLDGNTISRWERGSHRPSEFYIELLCEAFAPLFVGSTVGIEMDRRAFIRKSLGFGVVTATAPDALIPWARIEHAITGPRKVDMRTVEAMERVTLSLEALKVQIGPLELVAPTIGHLAAITSALDGPMAPAVRVRLSALAAETAGLVACAKAEAGDEHGSPAYLRIALQMARQANDHALGAWIMGRYTTSHPAYRTRPELRLRHFTEGAFGFAASQASPALRPWFAAKAADIYATLGRTDECLRALDQAESATLQRQGSPLPERPSYGVAYGGLTAGAEAWLLAERGASLSRLGQSDGARQAIAAALERHGTRIGRTRLWLLLAEARTSALDGEPEEACRQAASVAAEARDLSFHLVLDEVRHLHRIDLAPWAQTRAVHELGEQLAS